jgi:ABC-type Mn2+/Zn2+ transport system ATPase subunit
MRVLLENCNNIDQGAVDIVEGALNVKYAINGTGKSTIAKAITAFVDNNEQAIKNLTPYQYIGDTAHVPSVTGIETVHSVKTFDEAYINQYIYQPDDLLKDSFEILVKTPDYELHMEEIKRLLAEVNESFQNNPELDSLIKAFSDFIDGCGRSQNSIAASGAIYKAFGKGNHINNIPEGLEAFAPYLSNTQEAGNVKWLKWQVDGKKYLDMADQCPYCSGSVEHTKDTILRITQEYDSKAIEHLNRMLVLFEQLMPYFSSATNEQLTVIMNNAGDMTDQQKRYLFEIKDQISSMLNLLQSLKRLGFYTLKEADRVAEQLKHYEIDLNLFSHLQSDMMKGKVDVINESLHKVIESAGRLQGEVNKQNILIRNTIDENSSAINDFMKCAGYQYEVAIEESADNKYRLLLRSTLAETAVESAKNHLSYGERNALALALFMFSALKENPDLVVLDDPISSFDGNKKFALLNMLFLSTRCLRNRTVLLLTHDFNTVIDVISTMPYNFSPTPHGSFLSTTNRVLTEKIITKANILSFVKIANVNIEADIDVLNKAVFLRRLYEANGDKGLGWNMLSSLFHKRQVPTIQDEDSRDMTDDEIEKATADIRQFIPSFDYHREYQRTQNQQELISIYRQSRSNYEKLQIYRILYNENNDNPVVKKFVNETFHVENDYLFQLNPSEYDTIPQYIISECDKDIQALG